MGSNQDRVIRFGVGSPASVSFGVYRVWGADGARTSTRPSDLYLSARALAGTFKTSLHQSGQWRTGYTEGAVDAGQVTLPPGEDRKKLGWRRPPEWQPGVTWAYCVIFPSSELRADVGGDAAILKDVTWIDDPGPGHLVQVDVLLAESRIEQLNVNYPVEQDLRILDQFKLPNREGVLVVSRVLVETPQMVTELQAAKRRVAAEAAANGVDVSGSTLRTMVAVERDNGLMGFVDAAISGR